MKLLILGGTRFLGRHLAEAALTCGHELTLFNRGRSGSGLFPGVEQLLGDRAGDLSGLQGRRWDAVIDTCGYLPRLLRHSAQSLRSAVGRYLFISSVSVYADERAVGQDESAPRAILTDPACEDIANEYGALKAACEDEVLAAFGEKGVVVRPGLIVGPFDPSGRFTYWVQRVARGGTLLAPPAPDYPVQFIDARDLADWLLHLLDVGRAGAYNACGPDAPMRFDDFLDSCRRALAASVDFVWPSADFLTAHAVLPWTELPLWAGDAARGISTTSNARAVAAGLRFRSVAETVLDTAAWAGDAALPAGIGLAPEREAELLHLWSRGSAR